MLVYAVVYSFGLYYIYKLLHDGPRLEKTNLPAPNATGNRPLAFAGDADTATGASSGKAS